MIKYAYNAINVVSVFDIQMDRLTWTQQIEVHAWGSQCACQSNDCYKKMDSEMNSPITPLILKWTQISTW